MSIIWIRETVDSGGGSSDLNAGIANKKYHKTFQILTDDYDDGPQTISAHPDFPQPYEVYRAGTDVDEDALLTQVPSFKRVKKQPKLWRAECVYTVVAGMSGDTPGTMDVTYYTPSVRSWKVPYDKLVAMCRRQLIGTDWTAPVNSFATAMGRPLELVRNSINEIDPVGISTPMHAKAIEVRRYEWYHNLTLASSLEDKVNSIAFWGYAAGTVKMISITGTLTSVQNSLIYQVSYEFHYSREGWGVAIPDSGWHRHSTATGALPGSPGAITGVAAARDEVGTPRGTRCLLDGGGFSGGVSDVVAPGGNPYIVVWHHLGMADFNSISNFPTRASLNII